MKWPPFFISYFGSWPNARLRGDKHNPRNWVFPTLKVKKNLVLSGLHVDHCDIVDHYDKTFKSL